MKITLLTGYFAPEITACTHLLSNLASDLAKYGAEVTVVTNVPTRGIDDETRKKYRRRKDEFIEPNVRILRVGTTKKEGTNFFVRALRYMRNTYAIYQAAKKVETDVYLVTSTPPFLGIIGIFLARKAPAVYDLQDIFPDSLIHAGKVKEHSPLIALFRKIERYVYDRHVRIIAISRDFKRLLLDRGVKGDKIDVVYNWIDEIQVKPVAREDNCLVKRYGLEPGSFYVTHCGTIGHSQNLEMVIDIAKELEADLPDLRFVFIGDGAWKEKVEKHIAKRDAATVRLLPFQPYEDISDVMSLGDVSLVCSKANVGTSSFPSKTWGIMSAGRPVVCSFDRVSELCEIIEGAGCGICALPDDKKLLKRAIVYAYHNREQMKQMGENGRKYIEDNLTRKAATRRYFDILQSVAAKRCAK